MKQQTIGRKILAGAACFAVLAAVTIAILMNMTNISEVIALISGATPGYLAAAILCSFGFICCESINLGRVIRRLDGPSAGKRGHGAADLLKYGAAGFFFSGITPSSFGGQPMQLYYMHRDGIDTAHSSVALILEGICYQTASLIFAGAGLIYNFSLLTMQSSALTGVIVFGLAANGCILALLIGISFSKRVADGALRLVEWYAEKRKKDELRAKAEEQFAKYRAALQIVKAEPGLLFRGIATSLVQMTMIFSIPYLVYLSLGCSGTGWLCIALLQAVLSSCIALVPLPGGQGAAEGAFGLLFGSIFPSGLLIPGMLLSRAIGFYTGMIASGGILAGQVFRRHQLDGPAAAATGEKA